MLLLSAALLTFVLTSSFAQPPPPEPAKPQIPSTFEAEVGIEYHEEESHGVQFGDGYLLSDYEANRAKEFYNLTEHDERNRFVFYLQRYDLMKVYEINSEDPRDCHSHNVTGHLPDFWGFVEYAEYNGQIVFHERTVNCWIQRLSFGVEFEVCTDAEENPNTPVTFRRHTPEIEVIMEFRAFNGSTPSINNFEVPRECQPEQVRLFDL